MESIITYSIHGWTDKTKMADMIKENLTEIGAKRVYNRLIKSNSLEMLVMRKEELLNNGWEISTPIKSYEI